MAKKRKVTGEEPNVEKSSENKLVTQKELAKYLGCGPALIVEVCKDPKLPSVLVGKRLKYELEEVLKYLRLKSQQRVS